MVAASGGREVGIFAWIMQIGSLGTKRASELVSTQCRKTNKNDASHVTCHVINQLDICSISKSKASDWFNDCFDILYQSETSIHGSNVRLIS